MKNPLLCEFVSVLGHANDLIPAYLARPLGTGPFPVIVVLHHAGGLDEEMQENVRAFSARGYIAISPNLHAREEQGGLTMAEATTAIMSSGGVPDDRCLSDIVGAIDYARSYTSDNGKVGVIGYCSGGRQAYYCAGRLKVDAVVDAYGSRHFECWPTGKLLGTSVVSFDLESESCAGSPAFFTRDLSAPVLGLFGDADPHIPEGEIDQLHSVLDDHGKSHEFQIYPGATHAFFSVGRSGHRTYTTADVEAALDGWKLVWSWFDRHLW